MTTQNLQLLTHLEEIKTILNDQVLSTHNDVFASKDWVLDHADHANFTIADNDRSPRNLLHLKSYRRLGLKIAEFASEPYSQYNDIVVEDEVDACEFMQQAKILLSNNHIDALHLHNVRADAHLFNYCMENAIMIERKYAPYLNIKSFDDFAAYFASFSKTTKKQFKRFENNEQVQYHRVEQDDIDFHLVEKIVKLKYEQLCEKGQSSRVFISQGHIQELCRLIAKPSKDFERFISYLEQDGKMIAASISFIDNHKFYAYMIALDQDYAKSSPGNYLTLKNIEHAFNRNLAIFDFLGPKSDYKSRFTKNHAIETYDFFLPLNFKAVIFSKIYLKMIRKLLKKIYFLFKIPSL